MKSNNVAAMSEAWDIVLEYFKGDRKRALKWFKVPNPLLGNITPQTMGMSGKGERLLKIIKNMLAGEMA